MPQYQPDLKTWNSAKSGMSRPEAKPFLTLLIVRIITIGHFQTECKKFALNFSLTTAKTSSNSQYTYISIIYAYYICIHKIKIFPNFILQNRPKRLFFISRILAKKCVFFNTSCLEQNTINAQYDTVFVPLYNNPFYITKITQTVIFNRIISSTLWNSSLGTVQV